MREQYYEYIRENSAPGSGTAHSYVAALDMLGPILQAKSKEFSKCSDIWSVKSGKVINDLYRYILEEQRKKESGIFGGHEPSSYWKQGFYSAALGSYKAFLGAYKYIQKHEELLWKIYQEAEKPTAKLSRQLEDAEFESIEKIVAEPNIDFSTPVGREKLRLAKIRINQNFFRKMILAEYRSQCCLTGLNIPEVLRASHIIAWAEDEKNRMNPANGLCLSATYDAAFDRHLISFDDDYRMILSPSLREHYTNTAFKAQFLAFEGRKIIMPERFGPDQKLLAKHRARIYDMGQAV